MRRIALLLALAIAAGCGDKTTTPLLGKWSGALEILRVRSQLRGDGGNPKAYEMRGDLQIYVRKFELNLTGPQQFVTVKGTWSLSGKQLRLKTAKVEFPKDRAVDDLDPNKGYIEPDDLRGFFVREQGLALSSDGKRLAGVEDALADLVARLAFVKD